MSLPFIPASREVTRSRGRARRGHGKEVGGGSHCILQCVILLGVWLSSPSAAEHQPQPWVGRQGTGVTAISLGTPQLLGQQQPELLNLKLLQLLCESFLPTPARGQCLPPPPPPLSYGQALAPGGSIWIMSQECGLTAAASGSAWRRNHDVTLWRCPWPATEKCRRGQSRPRKALPVHTLGFMGQAAWEQARLACTACTWRLEVLMDTSREVAGLQVSTSPPAPLCPKPCAQAAALAPAPNLALCSR